MTAVQAIALVIVRFWALGAALSWLFVLNTSVDLLISGLVNSEIQGQAWLQFVSHLSTVIFWAVVLFNSKKITAWLLPPVREADIHIRIEPADIIRAGTFLIGVFYLMQYIPDFLRTVPGMVQDQVAGQPAPGFSQRWSDMLKAMSYLIVFAAALWMVARSGHLVRVFLWLRHAGRQGAAPEVPGKPGEPA